MKGITSSPFIWSWPPKSCFLVVLWILSLPWDHFLHESFLLFGETETKKEFHFPTHQVWVGNILSKFCLEIDQFYQESWVQKNWCFWTVVLEKTLESPLDWKKIQPVNPKGNQSWIFIGRTDAEAETPVFWPPEVKSWLIWKDPNVGKDWRKEEKGTAEGWDG